MNERNIQDISAKELINAWPYMANKLYLPELDMYKAEMISKRNSGSVFIVCGLSGDYVCVAKKDMFDFWDENGYHFQKHDCAYKDFQTHVISSEYDISYMLYLNRNRRSGQKMKKHEIEYFYEKMHKKSEKMFKNFISGTDLSFDDFEEVTWKSNISQVKEPIGEDNGRPFMKSVWYCAKKNILIYLV